MRPLDRWVQSTLIFLTFYFFEKKKKAPSFDFNFKPSHGSSSSSSSSLPAGWVIRRLLFRTNEKFATLFQGLNLFLLEELRRFWEFRCGFFFFLICLASKKRISCRSSCGLFRVQVLDSLSHLRSFSFIVCLETEIL